MIEHFAEKIDPALNRQSGKVFYSGRTAFSRPADLYLIGLNPGGDPVRQATETIGAETARVLLQLPDRWSAYSDESWRNKRPGTHQMQPRVLHMLRQLGRDPRETPASNLIFMRSRREANLGADVNVLVDQCWPFHEAVIASLNPKVIVCFGQTVGSLLNRKLKANERPIARFVETNSRGWATKAYRAGSQIVIVATHPSIADWTNPAADPTPLIQEMLDRSKGEKP
ncbi:hypothetical protein JQ596_28500 [Bradyrhizobium manausense]|uniref:hypothetical protein n=1 Tax=Bradyrhizobium TaxID=374 RepID=UPI001BAE1B24|nr:MULTISPECIES: hypothetical protein [Bradyrhizobium]MBR0829482.1 hypothetical protein [Bradyrhizobium manausense]UVO25857.1 uracil-DNA glycosylase family protein [Bradyrhizobium arachidis]